mgnify:CR=1 FL=1
MNILRKTAPKPRNLFELGMSIQHMSENNATKTHITDKTQKGQYLKKGLKKFIATIATLALVLNLTLFALQKIDITTFWGVIAFVTMLTFAFYSSEKEKTNNK